MQLKFGFRAMLQAHGAMTQRCVSMGSTGSLVASRVFAGSRPFANQASKRGALEALMGQKGQASEHAAHAA